MNKTAVVLFDFSLLFEKLVLCTAPDNYFILNYTFYLSM